MFWSASGSAASDDAVVKASNLPKSVFPVVSINVVYPGAGPHEVETLVTQAEYDATGNKTSETDRRGVVRLEAGQRIGFGEFALADAHPRPDAA